MSRLDRFFLSEKWCDTWHNTIQGTHQRGLSDHVPLTLHVDEANWGPRPLRMLKCWADFPSYEDFVRNTWGSFHIQGWGGYVLRKKLKMMKASIKEWHHHHSQNLNGKITTIKNRISCLDLKGESSVLHDDEIAELHELSFNLHTLARA